MPLKLSLAPIAPVEHELQWMTDDVINIIYHDTLLQYVIMAHDAYFGPHHRCRPQPMGHVYLYCHNLIVIIWLSWLQCILKWIIFLTNTLLCVRTPCMLLVSWRSFLAVMHLFEVLLQFHLPTSMRYVLIVILNLNF